MARHYDMAMKAWLDDDLGILVSQNPETGTEVWLTDYDPFTNQAQITETMNPLHALQMSDYAKHLRETQSHQRTGTQKHVEQKAILPGPIQNQIIREQMAPEDVDKWLDGEGRVWKTTEKSLTKAKRKNGDNKPPTAGTESPGDAGSH